MTILDRFAKFVDQNGPMPGAYTGLKTSCHLWLGSLNGTGYGKFWMGRLLGAHVAAYLLYKGDIGPHDQVLHQCDTRRCVNPDHLFLGTQADNMADMIRKGRQTSHEVMSHICKKTALRGERHWNSKLTSAQVVALRKRCEAGDPLVSVALDYGISRAAVVLIMQRKRWGWL